MKSVGADTPGTRRLKVLCTLCLGACIPLLTSALQELLLPGPRMPGAVAWAGRALPAVLLSGLVFVMVVAYRVVRYSKLPGIPVIVVMVLLVWALALLGHFS